MNKKNIHTLLIVLAVLAGGLFIQQQQVHRGVVSDDYEALDFSFDPAQAVKIVVSRGGKAELTASRETNGWVLPDLWNAAADSEKVEGFLKGISAIRGELRAEDAALLADFGIADESALSIQLTDEKNAMLADLRVGAKRAGPASVFIRRANSSAVFLANLDLFRMLGIYGRELTEPLQPRLWADLEPLSFRAIDLKKLEAVRSDGAKRFTTLQLKKEAGESQPWLFGVTYSGFTIDSAKVDTFIRALTTMRASNVVDPKGSYGFDAPALQLKIQTTEKEFTLTLGQDSADKKSRYLRVEGDDAVYEISKFTFEELLADDSRFFAAGIPGAATAAVEAVTLTKPGQEKRFLPAETNAFQSILQTLETLEFTGLLLTPDEIKKARSPGIDSVILEVKESEKIILDLGERLEGAPGQETRVAAQLRSNPTLFSMSEIDYTNLFEALKPPPADETNASQPVPNKAE